jgi:hypothetical protein
MGYPPWVKVDYKLPPMQVADLDSRTWTNRDFEGKTTIVYLWSSRCGPCSPNVGAIQLLSERVKSRRDVQVVTLSVDEERDSLAALMKQKGYTFPVLASKQYVQTVLPQFALGQLWIVDGAGACGYSGPTIISRAPRRRWCRSCYIRPDSSENDAQSMASAQG